MSDIPVDVIGRVRSLEAAKQWGTYVQVKDDYPGGVFVYHSEDPAFAGEVFDNWFENWPDTVRFLAQLGEIDWDVAPS